MSGAPPGGRRRVAWFAAAALLLALVLAAARPWQSRHPALAGLASSQPILRRANGAEPDSLDLHHARSEAALTILRDLYEGLTSIGPDGAPLLAAADRVERSADGATYRFHLRPAAQWSNGEPLRAEDFVAAWRRLVDPRTAAPYADMLAGVRNAAAIIAGAAAPESLGVQAPDPATLVVELVRPLPYFLQLLTHPATFPLNRASLAAPGHGFAKPGRMVSNGAFVLARWDFGSHLVAVRNPRYWNAVATQLQTVEYYSFDDAAAELRAFQTGQVDVTSTIPAAQTAAVKARYGSRLNVAPQLAVYYLGLNLRRGALGVSREMRQALALAIDRDQLVRAVTGAGESAAYTFVPPQVRDYSPPLPEFAGWDQARRSARARQLLEAAGLARLPTLELRYNAGELHERIAVAVAAMWKSALGIDTTLRAEEFKVLLQDIEHDQVDVFRASWLADYDDAYGFLQLLRSGAGINLPHYSNPRYDALLTEAQRAPDPAARRDALQRAEALMLADQPLIPLFFYVSKHLVQANVHGWRAGPMNVVYSKNLSKELPPGE